MVDGYAINGEAQVCSWCKKIGACIGKKDKISKRCYSSALGEIVWIGADATIKTGV
jgi:hypothetical protein